MLKTDNTKNQEQSGMEVEKNAQQKVSAPTPASSQNIATNQFLWQQYIAQEVNTTTHPSPSKSKDITPPISPPNRDEYNQNPEPFDLDKVNKALAEIVREEAAAERSHVTGRKRLRDNAGEMHSR